MSTVGKSKKVILENMVKFYSKNHKSEITKLLKVLNENKNYKEFYILYEDIEKIKFEDKDTAKFFVDELANSLKGKNFEVKKTCNSIVNSYKETVLEENELYDNLDILMEEDNILNINKKLQAKLQIIEHLMKEKINEDELKFKPVTNDKLFMSMLASNYNTLYENIMNEDEKRELKNIMKNVTLDNVEDMTKKLKEETLDKLNNMLLEENDDEIKKKLNDVLTEIDTLKPSRYNYYKLKTLKNGLN